MKTSAGSWMTEEQRRQQPERQQHAGEQRRQQPGAAQLPTHGGQQGGVLKQLAEEERSLD